MWWAKRNHNSLVCQTHKPEAGLAEVITNSHLCFSFWSGDHLTKSCTLKKTWKPLHHCLKWTCTSLCSSNPPRSSSLAVIGSRTQLTEASIPTDLRRLQNHNNCPANIMCVPKPYYSTQMTKSRIFALRHPLTGASKSYITMDLVSQFHP